MHGTRSSTDRLLDHVEDVNLGELVESVIGDFERELEAARCSVYLIAEQDVAGRWDRRHLAQICAILISNALRYGAGKPIRVRVDGDETHARLVVRDHGVGIAPDDHHAIFERFETAANGRREPGSLTIARRLCREMGGRIEVDSELGRGAKLTVYLPRAPG